MSEIQKVLNYPRGGGSSLIGNFSQIFPFFFVMAPLKKYIKSKQNLGSNDLVEITVQKNLAPSMDKCPRDKLCLDKCQHDSWKLFNVVLGSCLLSYRLVLPQIRTIPGGLGWGGLGWVRV